MSLSPRGTVSVLQNKSIIGNSWQGFKPDIKQRYLCKNLSKQSFYVLLIWRSRTTKSFRAPQSDLCCLLWVWECGSGYVLNTSSIITLFVLQVIRWTHFSKLLESAAPVLFVINCILNFYGLSFLVQPTDRDFQVRSSYRSSHTAFWR